ncbi:splicing factor, arginine/serine-rich, putative, partial [Ixodes scapularis]
YIMETCVAQVTNVAPTATLEQMSTLFGFLGKILEIKMYPSDEFLLQPVAKVCYIRYEEPWSVGVAQHLTNTVFVDRALIVVPVTDGKLPDESRALALTTPVSAVPEEPTIAALSPGLVNQMGEVKYVRMAGGESQPTRFAFVEFTEQSSVGRALQFNGIEFAGRSLKINHSNNSIVKPQAKSSEAAHKEIEEAMRRVREAQSLITAAIEPEMARAQAPRRSRSRSSRSRSSRRRSRSSSRHRPSRSGSRHRRSHRRSRSRPSSPGPRRRRRSSSSHRRRYSRSRTPPKKSRLKSRRDEFPETSRRRKKSRSPSSRKSSKRGSVTPPPRRSSKKRRKSRSPRRSKSRKEGKATVARDYDEEEKG